MTVMLRRMKWFVFLAGVGTLCMICFKTEQEESCLEQGSFLVTAKGQTVKISLWEHPEKKETYLFLPAFCKERVSVQVPTKNEKDVFWDGRQVGKEGKIRNLRNGKHELRVDDKSIFVNVMHSENIPSLFLTTDSGRLDWIESAKGNQEAGRYCMISPAGRSCISGKLDAIKARGNVTFFEEKKPYQISLSTSADLLGEGNAKKYVLEEICKNLDAMNTSQYFYICTEGEKPVIYAGPVWDYDKSLGNHTIENTGICDLHNPRGIYAATQQEFGEFWYHLYQIPEFRKAVIQYYHVEAAEIMREMAEIEIDRYGEQMKASAHMNAVRWDVYQTGTGMDSVDFEKSYQREILQLKTFLTKRLQYLNEVWVV